MRYLVITPGYQLVVSEEIDEGDEEQQVSYVVITPKLVVSS